MMAKDRHDVAGRLNLHVFLSGIENETRLFKEARYTLEQGVFGRVVVLGLWGEGLKEGEVTDYGLEIQRLMLWIRRFGDSWLLRRIVILRKIIAALSLIQYSFLCIRSARNLKPTHISCHNVLLLPTAWAAARFSDAKLIYVPHELETQRSGLTGFLQRIQELIERQFINAAAEVVVVCDPIADWYRATYGLSNVHVVRNVPEREAAVTMPVPEGPFRQRFNIPDSARVFIYQGIFGKARGTDRLIDIFSRLDRSLAHLVLMGFAEGTDKEYIDGVVDQHDNIHIQPAVPREWIISHTAGADIGLLIVERAPLSYQYALPNKFFEYAHAGVPILVSDNFAHLSEIISAENIGWSAPYDTIDERIVKLLEIDLEAYRTRTQEFAKDAVWEADASVFKAVYGA